MHMRATAMPSRRFRSLNANDRKAVDDDAATWNDVAGNAEDAVAVSQTFD